MTVRNVDRSNAVLAGMARSLRIEKEFTARRTRPPMPRLAIALAAFLLAILTISTARPGYAADWITVTGDGKFTVQMPSAAKEEIDMVDTEVGKTPLHIFMSPVGNDVAYGVFYSDFDGVLLRRTTPMAFLLRGQQGTVKKTKTTLRNSQQIQLGPWPGLSFVADNAQIVYSSHTYLVDNRLYQLVVVTTKEASDKQESARFFGSFNVSDK